MAAVIREPIHPNTAEPADMYHTAISAPGTARKTESAIYRSASARDITVMLTLCSGLRGAGGRWVDRGVAAARASKETMSGPGTGSGHAPEMGLGTAAGSRPGAVPARRSRIRYLGMSPAGSPLAAAVPGLTRSDPRSPGITRERSREGFRYRDRSGAEVTQREALQRIGALAIPPAWTNVWISPDPLGHIQATGVDSRGRTQYRYHQLWREQRDAQKFLHMLRFASVLPALRAAAVEDLARAGLDRDRVAAGAVRLIDLGLFRVGGERYAELDHHYGATTLEKRHVTVTRDGMMFDYVAKEGKRRAITVTDEVVLPTVRALVHSDNGLDTLFSYQHDGTWRVLHSHDVSNYIAARAGGHFTAKEFRTWNATVLMALALANAPPSRAARSRERVIAASIREVAGWLGDTPAVARKSYIDPQLISRYESAGELPAIPSVPVALPAPAEAEIAVAALLAAPS
jgi:DNA topoisomerase I